MSWSREKPYNELPLLPPAAELESKAVLKATIEARAQLAALEEACKRLPNPAVLINAIQVLEAQASSEIENIVTERHDKAARLCRPWIKYGEYVTIEIDTDAGTAIVKRVE